VVGHSQAQDKFFDSAGVQIRYVEKGSGEPIVLLHGYTSDIECQWVETRVLEKLSKKHRVIALDLRGHGKSGKPHEASQYGLESCKDIVRLLDHLNIERVHMVGYSYGTNIVAKLLTSNPDRFLTATLGGSAGLRDWNAQFARGTEEQIKELQHGMPYRSLILQLWPANNPPSEEMLEKYSKVILSHNDPLAHAALLRTYGESAVSDEQLAAVRVPTQVVVGSRDKKADSARALKKVWNELKLVVIDGATHSGDRGALKRPEFVKSVLDFAQEHSAAAVPGK
jgi:pimeloyl-ACP methyl ester carboxylesterase